MVLANEQVAGYLADRRLPTLYRVHEQPDPRGGRVHGRAARLPRGPHAAAAEAHEPAAGGRRGRRGLAARRRVRRTEARRRAFGIARAALAQAGVLLAEEPGPRRPRERRATATSPRRSGATRTWSHTARCSRGSASTTPRRRRTSSTRSGCTCRRCEREAMKIERDADDVCLAFLLERVLAEAGSGRAAGVRGRGGGPDREGRLRALRRGRASRASCACAACAAGGSSTSSAPRSCRRASGRELRLGDPIEVTVERVDAPRGRVDLAPIARRA